MANLPRAEVELAIRERHSQVGTKEARLRQRVLVLVFNCVNIIISSSSWNQGSTPETESILVLVFNCVNVIISSISSWNRGSTPEIERGWKAERGLVM